MRTELDRLQDTYSVLEKDLLPSVLEKHFIGRVLDCLVLHGGENGFWFNNLFVLEIPLPPLTDIPYGVNVTFIKNPSRFDEPFTGVFLVFCNNLPEIEYLMRFKAETNGANHDVNKIDAYYFDEDPQKSLREFYKILFMFCEEITDFSSSL